MAIVVRYFSTTGAGAEDGTTWADRAAFFSGGVYSTIITGFNFAGSDSLEVRLGPGTYSCGNVTFTGSLFANPPRPANPLTIHGCDTTGNRIVPALWNCCQGPLPVTDYPLWDFGTGALNIQNIILRCLSLLNNSTSPTINASGTLNFGNGTSAEYCLFKNTGGQAAGFGTTATAHSCHFITEATNYNSVVAGGGINVQNCRIQGNPLATTGTRRGLEGSVSGILKPAPSNCIIDCPTSAVVNVSSIAGNGLAVVGYTIVNCATVSEAAINAPNANSGAAPTSHNVVYAKNCFVANCGVGINTQNTAARIFENRLRNTTNYTVPVNSIIAGNYEAAGTDADEFVDAANGDYRIKSTSIYWGKGIGAGDEPASGGTSRPTNPFYQGVIG